MYVVTEIQDWWSLDVVCYNGNYVVTIYVVTVKHYAALIMFCQGPQDFYVQTEIML